MVDQEKDTVLPSVYFHHLKQEKSLRDDPVQDQAVYLLDEVYLAFLEEQGRMSWLHWLRTSKQTQTRSIYFYGGVGRGKSLLMDIFFHVLPVQYKRRVHFHQFMFEIHQGLKALSGQKNPIDVLIKKFARQCKVLCLDEFLVHDIADAMMLGGVLKALLAEKVLILTTSNQAPEELYRDGLQRSLFLPTIDLIYKSFKVFELDHGVDYRMLTLRQAKTWFSADERNKLMELFEQLSSGLSELVLEFRFPTQTVPLLRHVPGMMMVAAKNLFARPLGRSDYLGLTTKYHTLFVVDLYIFDGKHDEAKRWIWFIDLCYDHHVKLVISTDVPEVQDLYSSGQTLSEEFTRTLSRISEMQSESYLGLPHLTHQFSFL